jgi:hypothetical protein
VRQGWAAAIDAARARRVQDLEAVVAVAKATHARAEGSVASDAQGLVVYCSTALSQARMGVRERSPVARLLMRDRGEPMKICPDCAEPVQAAARICRYCRYEFEPPPG